MKSRETLIRLKKFQVDEKRRRVAQIESMIADFDRMAVELEREIRVEQERAGIHDPGHFAYPTYAKAAIQRRENIKRSGDELRVQLDAAKNALADAFEELKKVELLDERDQMRERAAEEALDVDVEVVPGVTAALAAAAVLGAPLAHDHAVISLSDLLTPWSAIEARLRAAAASDLVVALYNPRSRGRSWQLDAARRVLLEHRARETPVGVVTDATRPGQDVALTTLGALDPETVGMSTCVVVGSSTTSVTGGRMVTPRGYRT